MGKLILNGVEYINNRIDGYPPIIYSGEEREVGVWIDGKPLYKKSFVFQNSESWSNDKTFDTGINNLEWGWVEASFRDYSQNRIETLPFFQSITAGSATPSSYMQLSLNFNTSKLVLRTGSTWNVNTNRYLKATVYYTKTTDTPGSGKWSPSGLPAKHYSTNEQVIGTWIDGKPLYEKVIESPATSANTNIDLSALNISEIIKIDVSLTTDDEYYFLDGQYFNSSAYTGIRFQKSTGTLRLNLGSALVSNSTVATCTIQYTKTTD